ncbi:ankyrin repeat domain containing protein [Apiospora rasikravindrae]|uniref:Ankyrin repeat domain containing protein n=1 Tax=Apiospora rasikravindrae TaxID=990691 RepID=A0ABR1T0H4_9PEZI
MSGLQAFPGELLEFVLEQLVVIIGIQKAVRLRTVSRAFDAAILHAICVRQVVDIDDPATPCLASRVEPGLRGRIIAAKSRSASATAATGTADGIKSHISVVATVNQLLDGLLGEDEDPELRRRRRESIAQAVLPVKEVRADDVYGSPDSHDMVDQLLGKIGPDRDAPLDHVLVEGQNLLSGAVVTGNLALLKLLLQQHPNVRLPASGRLPSRWSGVSGVTPYFPNLVTLAATWGHLEVVRHLLSCGARIDSESKAWRTRLSPASQADWPASDWYEERDHFMIMYLLSKYGPSTSPLCAAVRHGHGHIVRLLLRPEHRLPLNSIEYLSAILAGAEAGRLDLIEILLEMIGKRLSDFPGLESELLWAAVRCGHQHIVEKLLDCGADVDALPNSSRQYYGALTIAASRGNMAMVRLLLERGAEVNIDGPDRPGHLPIQAAARSGQEEVVQLLLEHGADPRAAAVAAAQGGQPRVLRALLSRFPDLLRRGTETWETGQEALAWTLQTKNLTTLTVLVNEAGVDLEDCSLDGDLPCGWPSYRLRRRLLGRWVVEHLIALGARTTTDEDEEFDSDSVPIRGVYVSERTWEWVSKY